MSSFFTTPASQRKRKRQDSSNFRASQRKPNRANKSSGQRNDQSKRGNEDEESISGSDSEIDDSAAEGDEAHNDADSDSDSADGNETVAERRLKLAERYLDNIRAEVGEEQQIGFDAAEIDRELIAARLKEDVAEGKGRVYKFLAGDLDFTRASTAFFRADTLATLGIALCLPYVYTVSKDMRLIKWQLVSPGTSSKPHRSSSRTKPKLIRYTRGNKNQTNTSTYQHHTAPILCIAASPDGKFVVTGGADRKLIVWDAHTLKPLKVFTHHRDAVTGLAFRGSTNQLFSASKDRTVKIWSLNELAYVETLFGHQDEVVDVAAVGQTQERCVSVGARDRTARLWKVIDESQLVFRGGGTGNSSTPKRDHRVSGIPENDSPDYPSSFVEGSLDRVTQIDSQLFVTGSDSGALSLFSLHKKKPLHVLPLAHGCDPPPDPSQSSAEVDPSTVNIGAQPTPRWITALKAIPFSDLFVSGSWDGVVRVWRIAASSDDEQDDVDKDAGGKGKSLRRIEPAGVLGQGELLDPSGIQNGNASPEPRLIRGIINDLDVAQRGNRGKDGICIVAAIGTEPRLGRWMKKKGKNGAMIFEIPKS